MNLKLNVLLGKTDHLAATFKQSLKDYISFFKGKQDHFRGEKKTYLPIGDNPDLPEEKHTRLVVTTVKEKFDWLKKINSEYVDALMSQERTNASSKVKAPLIVEGEIWGEFSSLELLKLKTILETQDLKNMLEEIPTRNEDEIWETSNSEDYASSREIYQTKPKKGIKRTTTKDAYIVPNPDIGKTANYNPAPQLAYKDNILELGEWELRRYSGEWTHVQRSNALDRRSTLLSAVLVALKVANETEVIESELKSDKIFSYLLEGKK